MLPQLAPRNLLKPNLMTKPVTSPASTQPSTRLDTQMLALLAQRIKGWGKALGFNAVGISDIDVSHAEAGLHAWLAAGYHGEMDYMAKHGTKRTRPAELVPGTVRVISVRMSYVPSQSLQPVTSTAKEAKGYREFREREEARLKDPHAAVVSIYARGRDYHKVMRKSLQKLADQIVAEIGPFGHRVFVDSAPVSEVELARKAGLGWRGKHTLLLHRDAGSLFFLGEIYVDLPLPTDAEKRVIFAKEALSKPADDAVPASSQATAEVKSGSCGHCTRCIDICPTQAIVAPYRLDARRCISYLTIELKGSIPEALRPLIGNRIYGCDDCQLVCPWNKFAQAATLNDFEIRNGLDQATLLDLFNWSEKEFNERLAGSAIRRIGYERWLRNIAVALGNALRSFNTMNETQPLQNEQRTAMIDALQKRAQVSSELVREHVLWALQEF